MTASTSPHITISEWETVGPENHPELAGRSLGDSKNVREIVAQMAERRSLGITELRQGLQVEAYSHVGRIRIGDLHLTILPKIRGRSLLNLMRYAYGLRPVQLISEVSHHVDEFGIEDLLISQLIAEVEELVARGLARSYVPKSERLGSLRGRIDTNRLAAERGSITATLPCKYYPRVEDVTLNRILLAGLRFSAELTRSLELRRESRRIAMMMNDRVSPLRLEIDGVERAMRNLTRLHTAYASALQIIRLLLEAQGATLSGPQNAAVIPGFLFDMNAFYQALLSRFLRENLPDCNVQDERTLRGIMRYQPGFEPRQRQLPGPRPDFVIERKGATLAILDAKYRELWEKPLPRDMLYQLAIYAMSHSTLRSSTILYPTTSDAAKEARIEVREPHAGTYLGRVCLRPVHLPTIERLLRDTTSQSRTERKRYARNLAFGSA